jgi:acyl-CoA synthetase (AMP-forming)/AMP-acid ligase II
MTEVRTVSDALEAAARAEPERRGWVSGDEEITFAGMQERTDRLATGLLSLGIGHGDRIALNAPNLAEWVEVYLAAARIGAVVVGLNVRYRSSELAHILDQSAASAVVTVPELAGTNYLELVRDLGIESVRHVVTIGDGGDGLLDELRAHEPDHGRLAAAAGRVAPDDPVMIIYTSGTTGAPKGATLTHRSQLAAARAQVEHCRMNESDVLPVALPLNHVGGLTCGVIACLLARACCVLIPAFGRAAIHDAFDRFRPTIWTGVPTMHTVLLGGEHFSSLDTGSVRIVISGGSNADPALLERIQAAFPNATVMNLYGASETSGAVVMSPWESDFESTVRSVGRPIGDAHIKIVDADGSSLPTGETGEVCIASDSLAQGYYKMPEATAVAFRGGWLHTGDLGSLDERGYLTLRGRTKELFIQGGYNVYPVEVENVLSSHPAVQMCAGIGVPDPVLGEIGRYYVVAAPESQPTADELIEHCRRQLADYKVPREIVFRAELPLTPAGKVRKAALMEEARRTGR